MKKAFEIFHKINENKTEKDFKLVIKKVLRSYQWQINMGILDLNAFENSLINPTTQKSKKIKINEEEIKNSIKKQNSPKLNKLFLYQSKIDTWIREGLSMRKMRRLLWELHRFRCSHETIRKYVKMVCEEEKINKI